MKQHYDSLFLATILAISALAQVIYQSRTHYILAAESSIAILLHSSNYIKLSAFRSHLHWRMAKFLAVLLFSLLVIVPLNNQIPSKSQPLISMQTHPIEELIQTSRNRFSETLQNQSRTLNEAVQTYQRRTGMHPPPKFDIWF